MRDRRHKAAGVEESGGMQRAQRRLEVLIADQTFASLGREVIGLVGQTLNALPPLRCFRQTEPIGTAPHERARVGPHIVGERGKRPGCLRTPLAFPTQFLRVPEKLARAFGRDEGIMEARRADRLADPPDRVPGGWKFLQPS
jgi:hypothetical protein